MASWNPAIRRYFIFRGLLSRVFLPILVIFMADQGLDLGQIALVTVAGKVVSLIFEIPSGAIADTIGHRRALVISLLGQALAALLFLPGTLPWIMAGTVLYFLAGTLLTGTGEALFFEYIKSIGRETDHLKLWGEGKSMSRLLNLVAVFIGGASYALSPSLPFLICAAQFIAAAICINGFPSPPKSISVTQEEGFMQLLRHFPRALKSIWSVAFVFWLVVMNALLIGSISGTNDFQQLIFDHLGATTIFIGAVYAIKRVVSMILNSYAHRLATFGAVRIMTVCTVMLAAYAFLTPFISSFWLYGAVVLIASAIYGLLEVFFNDSLNKAIPSLSRATTISVANFATSAVGIGSALLFGSLHLPLPQLYAVLGMLIILCAIVPLIRLYQTQKI